MERKENLPAKCQFGCTHSLMALKTLCITGLLLAGGFVSAQTTAPATASASAAPVTTYVLPEVLFKVHPLPMWPQDASATAADLNEVLAAQAKRKASDVQEALLDAGRGPVAWAQDAAGLGTAFTDVRYPITTALLLTLNEDMRAINRAGNAEHGTRVRPARVDARVKSIFAESLAHSASYPSARSASSRVWALLLADVFPQRRASLLAHADRTAELRLLGGAHFPTDIQAGKDVGAAYYALLLKQPKFQQWLEQAKQEAQATPG